MYYNYDDSFERNYDAFYEEVSDAIDTLTDMEYDAQDNGFIELAAEIKSYIVELENLDYTYYDDIANTLANVRDFIVNNK